MWAALVAAIGIGVVWAGGRRTGYLWMERFWEGQQPQEQYLIVNGLLGGVVIEWRSWSTMIMSSPFKFEVNLFRWMWLPSLDATSSRDWVFRLPYWIPTLLCLTTFGLLFRIERREKRLAGHCGCGYSLAGLAEGAVCPECGKGKTLT